MVIILFVLINVFLIMRLTMTTEVLFVLFMIQLTVWVYACLTSFSLGHGSGSDDGNFQRHHCSIPFGVSLPESNYNLNFYNFLNFFGLLFFTL